MNKKVILKLTLCAIVSFLLSYLFEYNTSKVIDYYVIINIVIALFSVSLAIVTLMITILEKYKEKVADQNVWAQYSTKILKEISENTIALFLLIILLSIASMLESALILIPKLDAMTIILLFTFLISLLIMLDTTISIYKLVTHLKGLLYSTTNKELNLSQTEINLIEAYRFLDDKYKKEFENLIKAISIEQQIESREQQEQK